MKLSPALTVLVSFVLIGLASVLLSAFLPYEFFGSQGGAQVQLATSHVPTEEDLEELMRNRARVKREIVDMTGYW